MVKFIARFIEFQQVKADHYHLEILLQSHEIPMSNSEVISMDFVVGFPLTSHRNDAIMVVVDKLTKAAHFIPIKETYDVLDVT